MQKFKGHPLSLFLNILVKLATLLTVGVLVAVVGYILIMGIPNLKPSLFEWEYTTDNVSMMPAIINTLTMTALALLIADKLRNRDLATHLLGAVGQIGAD